LAKKVHEYLEEEKKKSTIDIEVAFPVIQRQWDAVSAFGPQIVQRSIHYLRVSEQSSEVREPLNHISRSKLLIFIYTLAHCRGHCWANAFG
jgi:hypothetical protein